MCSAGRAGYAKEVPEHFVVPALYAFSISSRASELNETFTIRHFQCWSCGWRMWIYCISWVVLNIWGSSVFVCMRWQCLMGSPACNLAALICYCLYSRLHWYKLGVKQSCESGSILYPITWQWEVRAVLLWQEINTDWKVKLGTAKKCSPVFLFRMQEG